MSKIIQIPSHARGRGAPNAETESVNHQHHLARGLVYWLRPTSRDAPFVDIGGRRFIAKYVNDTAGHGYNFSANSPRGGIGSSDFALTTANKELYLEANPILDLNLPVSFSLWAYILPGFTWWRSMIAKPVYNAAGGFALMTDNDTPRLGLYMNGATIGTYSLPAGTHFDRWHHITAVLGATTQQLYINGVVRVSGTYSTGFTPNTDIIKIGEDTFAGSFRGYMTDLLWWNRSLSKNEASLLYMEAMAGYPNFLNRSPISYFIPAAATGNSSANFMRFFY